MFALIENNAVTQVGEPAQLFPNTSGANAAYALEQGALEVIEGEQKDQRFYWVTFSHYEVQGSNVVRVYTNTPKALEDVINEDGSVTQGLKSQQLAQVKQDVYTSLLKTDWAIIRKIDRGIDVPAEIAAERAKIIADAVQKEDAIKACTTVEQLIAVVAPVNMESPK